MKHLLLIALLALCGCGEAKASELQPWSPISRLGVYTNSETGDYWYGTREQVVKDLREPKTKLVTTNWTGKVLVLETLTKDGENSWTSTPILDQQAYFLTEIGLTSDGRVVWRHLKEETP